MKYSLELKMLIFIIVFFGLAIGGFFIRRTLIYAYYEYRLESENQNVRAQTIAKIVSDREFAMPFIRRWLKSPNEKLNFAACDALV